MEMTTLIIVGVIVLIAIITIIGILSRYRKCKSDELLVVYGKTGSNPAASALINKSCEIIINLITKIMVKVLNSRELMSRDFKSIPDAVILAFNTLIVKNWNGLASAFKQSDVIAYIASDNITEEEAIKNHWLDVEPIYRANGFGVKYVGRGSDAEFTFWKA